MKDESKQPFRILKSVDEGTGILDKDLTPAVTSGNESPTGLTLTNTPLGDRYVTVRVNGISYTLSGQFSIFLHNEICIFAGVRLFFTINITLEHRNLDGFAIQRGGNSCMPVIESYAYQCQRRKNH